MLNLESEYLLWVELTDYSFS